MSNVLKDKIYFSPLCDFFDFFFILDKIKNGKTWMFVSLRRHSEKSFGKVT